MASNKIKHLGLSKSADWQNWHRIGTGIFGTDPSSFESVELERRNECLGLIATRDIQLPDHFALPVVLDLNASLQPRAQGLRINQSLAQHGM